MQNLQTLSFVMDSENAEHNLEIAQILRLCRTYMQTHTPLTHSPSTPHTPLHPSHTPSTPHALSLHPSHIVPPPLMQSPSTPHTLSLHPSHTPHPSIVHSFLFHPSAHTPPPSITYSPSTPHRSCGCTNGSNGSHAWRVCR